jgi:CHASE3 domain sensor protein
MKVNDFLTNLCAVAGPHPWWWRCTGVPVVNETGYQRARAGIRSAEEIYNQRVEVRRLQLLLQAAEAGQRGYLLTGQREYREPFEQAQAQLESQVSRIRTFFADDADSQGNVREIEDLARRKMSELRTTVGMFECAMWKVRSRW